MLRFYGHERLALMIDGPNTFHAVKELGFEIDYAKVQALFARQGTLVASRYFTRMLENTDDFNPMVPLVEWLGFNGWQVITRDKDPDVDLAVTAMELSDYVDHLILMSGDSDFVSLVEAFQRKAKRVTIISTIKTKPAKCSDDLRCGADQFEDLFNLKSEIARPAKVREAVTA